MNEPFTIDITPTVISAVEPYVEGMSACVGILLRTLIEVGDDSTLETFQRLRDQRLQDESLDPTALGVTFKICNSVEDELKQHYLSASQSQP